MARIAVITVSDRVSAGIREDLSGPLAAQLLRHYGEVDSITVIPDGVGSVSRALEEAVSNGARVVFTTGGTGVTERDATPEGTAALLTQRMEGIEHLLRSNPNVPHAALSRGLAGIAKVGDKTAFVLNAPGSQGGVRDAVRIIGPLLDHIVSQMDGGDHLEPQSHEQADRISRTDHADATRAVQNRGRSDGKDALVTLAGVSQEKIFMHDLEAAVDDDSAGAVVTFCGQVRNHDNRRPVIAIDYEAHPDADAVVRRIAQKVASESGACKVAVLHRTGHLGVGDVALGAAVSASHRKEAFAVLQEVVEQVKMQLPVWKCQHFEDGTKEWTGAA